jgi:signal transduction histidine kinase
VSLSNAARHASARHLVVTFRREDGRAALVVADDGVGFDPSRPVAAGHDGLGNMRTRAKAMGATLRVESAKGRGHPYHRRVDQQGRFLK